MLSSIQNIKMCVTIQAQHSNSVNKISKASEMKTCRFKVCFKKKSWKIVRDNIVLSKAYIWRLGGIQTFYARPQSFVVRELWHKLTKTSSNKIELDEEILQNLKFYFLEYTVWILLYHLHSMQLYFVWLYKFDDSLI